MGDPFNLTPAFDFLDAAYRWVLDHGYWACWGALAVLVLLVASVYFEDNGPDGNA
jgi:hypothetical protein